MSADAPSSEASKKKSPATQFFLKGLAISLPPILTLVILIWVAQGIYRYMIKPTSLGVQWTIAHVIEQSQPIDKLVEWEKLPPLKFCGRNYLITPALKKQLEQRLASPETDKSVSAAGQIPASWVDETEAYVPFRDGAVPYSDYKHVAYYVVTTDERSADLPSTVTGVYMEFAVRRRFQGQFWFTAGAVSILIVLVYFLGRIVTVRLGAWAVHKIETLFLSKVPIISNVYSSVKQVTDFFFTERTLEYNRVVAVEYPRRGLWSLGFVTSDSLLEITAAAGEPLVSVLMPTSPMPMTGFTINVPRSEVLDLNITVEQAFQYCLSCGVLVPPQQQVTPELLQQELARRLAGAEVSGVRRDKSPSITARRGAVSTSGPTDEQTPPAETGRQKTEDSQ